MKTIYEKAAIKNLRRMPQKMAQLIMEKVKLFAEHGSEANVDVKKLVGTANEYRLRQGKWRVLMFIENETLIVADVKPRGDVYK